MQTASMTDIQLSVASLLYSRLACRCGLSKRLLPAASYATAACSPVIVWRCE